MKDNIEVKAYRPLILISNDDGINSPGLCALIESLMPFGDLLIAAPQFQQTGMGRGFLYGEDIGVIEEKKLNTNSGEVIGYAINGSPAQAVAHAVLELADRKPDFCVSGINYGENVGLSYTCSGTLGAAFEADSFGIPSIAFSREIPFEYQKSEDFKTLDWEVIKFHIGEIFKNVLNNSMAQGVRILNVNFPVSVEENTSVRITRQAYMNHGEYINPEKRDYNKGYQLKYCTSRELDKAYSDTDIYALQFEKVISVTPMTSILSVDVDKYHG